MPRRITPPAVEPVSLAEAKAWNRIDGTDEDALVQALIVAARTACEEQVQRTLVETTWEQHLDGFPDAIRLEHPPLLAVDSVEYTAPDGQAYTLAPQDYQVDTASEPGWLVPAPGAAWPATREQPNAVRVQYRAGYGATGAAVPEPLRLWILLHVGHYYRNREASGTEKLQTLPHVGALLDAYRVYA